jgi:hypothetical protein
LLALVALLRGLEGVLHWADPLSGLHVEVRLEGGRFHARCWTDDDETDDETDDESLPEGSDDARW